MSDIDQPELVVDPREVVRFRGRDLGRWPVYHMLSLLLSAVVIANALIALGTSTFQVRTEESTLAATPITRFVPLDPNSPRSNPSQVDTKAVVVVAHGFVGSQQIMWPFATTLARNGYAAETFDFPGHGGNGMPFTDIAQLQATLDQVVQDARQRWPGKPIMLLGHSMGAGAVIEYAAAHPDAIEATIAVSPFMQAPPQVRNFAAIVGAWETAGARNAAQSSMTAPDRKLIVVPNSEHALVEWNHVGLRAVVEWVDQVTGTIRTSAKPGTLPAIYTDVRMPAMAVQVLGAVWFWWSLSFFAFRRPGPILAANLPWQRVLILGVAVAILTPLLLLVLPTTILPLEVGSYLIIHLAVFGLLTLVGLRLLGAKFLAGFRRMPKVKTLWSMLLLTGFVIATMGTITEHWWLNLWPPLVRLPWILVAWVLVLPFFLADTWLTSHDDLREARLLGIATKILLLVSVAVGAILTPGQSFLQLILPVLLGLFVLLGWMGERVTRRSGNPWPAAFAQAAIFAWILAVTFPLNR